MRVREVWSGVGCEREHLASHSFAPSRRSFTPRFPGLILTLGSGAGRGFGHGTIAPEGALQALGRVHNNTTSYTPQHDTLHASFALTSSLPTFLQRLDFLAIQLQS